MTKGIMVPEVAAVRIDSKWRRGNLKTKIQDKIRKLSRRKETIK